jgi:hypothetical protein
LSVTCNDNATCVIDLSNWVEQSTWNIEYIISSSGILWLDWTHQNSQFNLWNLTHWTYTFNYATYDKEENILSIYKTVTITVIAATPVNNPPTMNNISSIDANYADSVTVNLDDYNLSDVDWDTLTISVQKIQWDNINVNINWRYITFSKTAWGQNAKFKVKITDWRGGELESEFWINNLWW